jgi:hypothetical protein
MTVAPAGAAVAAPAAPAAPRTRFPAMPTPSAASTSPERAGGAAAIERHALSSLAAIDRAQARLDAVLAAARNGRTFTAAELIGLQAQAYRCAQAVDLASKLAEQGAQSVKQALNTQL